MEYTIKKMAQLSGVSARTLRYYDEIGLLYPKRINSAGYRIYGKEEVDRLQQILFYRSLDLKLEQIKAILDQPDFNILAALDEHYRQLLDRKEQLETLLQSVKQTIAYQKGEISMTDSEKFTAFKKERLTKNEQTFGAEVHTNYDPEFVKQSNEQFANLSEAQYNEMQAVEQQLFDLLAELLTAQQPTHATQTKLVDLHKKWLLFVWPSYSKKAHKGLAEMYLADPRFTAYYDKIGVGATQILVDAIRNS